MLISIKCGTKVILFFIKQGIVAFFLQLKDKIAFR